MTKLEIYGMQIFIDFDRKEKVWRLYNDSTGSTYYNTNRDLLLIFFGEMMREENEVFLKKRGLQ